MPSSDEQMHIENDIEEIRLVQPRPWWKWLRRRWKYAVLVGILLLAFLITLVLLLSKGERDMRRGFTLDEIIGPEFVPKPVEGKWSSDGCLLYINDVGELLKYDPNTQHTSVLVTAESDEFLQQNSHELSHDGNFVLVRIERKKKYHHSHEGYCYAIEVDTEKTHAISKNTLNDLIDLCVWSTVGNALVFSQNNNLYYKKSVVSPAVQITRDGNPRLRNGFTDWIYEEEIFSSNEALWFSPGGKHLAFLQFDDRPVSEMMLTVYGEPGLTDSQYLTLRNLEYPKTGMPNPKVKLLTVDLDSGSVITEMLPPYEMRNIDHVITGVAWRDPLNVVTVWTNRVQNVTHMQTCSFDFTDCMSVMRFEHATGWFEPDVDMFFSEDASEVALIHSQLQGAEGAFSHVTIFSVINGSETPVTTGLFNVQLILKWDHKANIIFFLGNTEENAHHTQVYAVRPYEHAKMQCLTCHWTENGVLQTNFEAVFSDTGKHVLISILGPSVPVAHLYVWKVSDLGMISFTMLNTMNSNEEIRHRLATDIAEPVVEHLDLPLPTTRHSARVKLMRPLHMDLTGKTKYPLVVFVYGGPNTYYGKGEWSVGWGSCLASTRNIVVAIIDGRGSGRRGDASLHAIYRRLGTVEIEDQLTAIEALTKRLPYIDASRIGIFGWSYGGYASLKALAIDRKNVLKCGIAVAPVTDWLYYDTMYTERYMGLPYENERGYRESSLIRNHGELRNKTLFIAHGTMDDNVHYQNTMQLARILQLHGMTFELMSYPDEDHTLANVQVHLYYTISRFLGRCFNMKI